MRERLFAGILLVLLAGALAPAGVGHASTQGPDIEQFKVKGVHLDPESNSPVVVMESMRGGESFPIWIGLSEAQAIEMALEHVVPGRPMTHDLLKNILVDLKAKVTRVTITDLRDGVYYASISVHPQEGKSQIAIDSRPSDAIALALRVHAPIFVARKVLDQVVGAIPSIQQIAIDLRRGFGFGVQKLTPDLAKFFGSPSAEGLLVSDVVPGGPADSAGVRVGDIILAMNSRTVFRFSDLRALVRKALEVGKLKLMIRREKGERRSLNLSSAPRSPK